MLKDSTAVVPSNTVTFTRATSISSPPLRWDPHPEGGSMLRPPIMTRALSKLAPPVSHASLLRPPAGSTVSHTPLQIGPSGRAHRRSYRSPQAIPVDRVNLEAPRIVRSTGHVAPPQGIRAPRSHWGPLSVEVLCGWHCDTYLPSGRDPQPLGQRLLTGRAHTVPEDEKQTQR